MKNNLKMRLMRETSSGLLLLSISMGASPLVTRFSDKSVGEMMSQQKDSEIRIITNGFQANDFWVIKLNFICKKEAFARKTTSLQAQLKTITENHFLKVVDHEIGWRWTTCELWVCGFFTSCFDGDSNDEIFSIFLRLYQEAFRKGSDCLPLQPH